MIIFKFIRRAIYKTFEVTVLYLIPLIVILLISRHLLISHMEHYSVYYSKHIDHSPNIDPEVIMVMKNLNSIEKPKDDSFVYQYKDSYLNDYRYYTVKKLNKKNHYGELESYIEFNTKNDKFEYIDFVDHARTQYSFNNSYKIEYVLEKDFSDVSLRKVNEKRVKQEMRDILQPIIDVQPKPKVNLQWVFNWMYGDYFK
ncbi:hypothetical protein V5G65_10435 [Mammaliicoccus sciuri]|uniref:hypothetical protein n=1 Tax=Mammaliicoccus TaxID=2803850 RepID=UPI001954EF10|nr:MULTISPECIES: hypothetical protein [Mammaliicoccus]MCJ1782861.1 hypothetical protein [Mammaliicoccus sciuri]